MNEALLVRVLTRLVQVHSALGDEAYENAAHASLLAIARIIHEDAVRCSAPSLNKGNVVPLHSAKRPRRPEQEDIPFD